MSKAFFGGLPTALDIRRLNDAFPILQEGDELSHEQVSGALGIDSKSNRYRTVTSAWRKTLLNERNIELGAVAGVGFRCLSPVERVNGGVKGFQSGTRKQMRSVKRVIVVRTDDPVLQRKQDVLQRFGAAITAQASTMMKEIEPPRPPQSGPRATPPGQ